MVKRLRQSVIELFSLEVIHVLIAKNHGWEVMIVDWIKLAVQLFISFKGNICREAKYFDMTFTLSYDVLRKGIQNISKMPFF